ncbi:ABC transporter permease [Anaerocolumna sp. MB42-C2]|uniref:ABC transporter permease n=1 Tax=Anaerocolumna sp. MB42-C2 TaxID=3070997 RepID=UPI0027DF2291|nr:ABC transporter permease subunit [Anaerocolumna sp. MB42-C2]WMJ85983.1 ABC transporter permease subunit [Anaerocolumna sp. MB42-C2]
MKNAETKKTEYNFPKESLKKRMWKAKWFYLLMLPGLIYFIVYKYIPMWGILMAFENYMPGKGIIGSDWVGLKHFANFFSGDKFEMLFRNTMIISVGSLVLSFPVPIILSLMLNEVRNNTYKKSIQTVLYLPHFLSSVVICSLAYVLFSTEDGIINQIIVTFGGAKVNILMNKDTYYGLFIGTGIWQGAGWGTIIYLAALAGVDLQLYEAAKIDGANRWKQLLYITIPSLLPIIMIQMVLSLGNVLDVSVEKTLLLSNAMNRNVAEVFDSFVYNRGIVNGEYSYSTAVGLFKSSVGVILVLGANWLSKKVTDEAIY